MDPIFAAASGRKSLTPLGRAMSLGDSSIRPFSELTHVSCLSGLRKRLNLVRCVMTHVHEVRDFNKQAIVSKSGCHVKAKGYLVLSVAGTISFGADAGAAGCATALFGVGTCAGF